MKGNSQFCLTVGQIPAFIFRVSETRSSYTSPLSYCGMWGSGQISCDGLANTKNSLKQSFSINRTCSIYHVNSYLCVCNAISVD